MLTLRHQKTSGPLPTSEYVLFRNEEPVGFIQIRHQPSHAANIPAEMASHVYYEILPGFRGKGYGREILRLGLVEAGKIGLQELIIICLENNVASKRVIEANGGELAGRTDLGNGRGVYLKYVIRLG